MKCTSNSCQVLEPEWSIGIADMCYSLGDCGVKENYIGQQGYNTESDARSDTGGPVCSDGIDNDMDGDIDFPDDSGCQDAGYYSEAY